MVKLSFKTKQVHVKPPPLCLKVCMRKFLRLCMHVCITLCVYVSLYLCGMFGCECLFVYDSVCMSVCMIGWDGGKGGGDTVCRRVYVYMVVCV